MADDGPTDEAAPAPAPAPSSSPEGARGYRVVSTRSTRPRRGRETARDMVLSMAVIGALVAIVLAAQWRPSPDEVRTVDWQPMVTAASDSLDWPVLAPAADLPGWRATSARIVPLPGESREVFLGWVTSDGDFASLRQAGLEPGDIEVWRRDVLGDDVREAGAYTDDRGRVWTRMEDDAQRALVMTSEPVDAAGGTAPVVVAYVIRGSAAWADLQSLADAVVER